MSSVGSKGVIIQDALGGDAVTVTDGKLDVNATLSANVSVALDSNEDSVECIQDTPGDLNATVTQTSAARTVTGDVEIISGTAITSYAQFDVDTSAIQLSSGDGIGSAVTTAKEIIIQCNFNNTGYVMIGSAGVVADTNGIRLEAGDTLTLAATTTANIYLRGSENDQLVNVMVIS